MQDAEAVNLREFGRSAVSSMSSSVNQTRVLGQDEKAEKKYPAAGARLERLR